MTAKSVEDALKAVLAAELDMAAFHTGGPCELRIDTTTKPYKVTSFGFHDEGGFVSGIPAQAHWSEFVEALEPDKQLIVALLMRDPNALEAARMYIRMNRPLTVVAS
ncbi:MAG: hypothetical protein GC129_06310 [Proteobacteria bacterium]|nr:hypothetical protein [Pseudomonadota bacterium]